MPFKTRTTLTKHCDESKVGKSVVPPCTEFMRRVRTSPARAGSSSPVRLFTGGNESEPEPDVCSDDLLLCTALKCAGAAGKRPEELMSFGGSIFLIAVGLVLALAVNVSVSGIDLQLVGWILALVGALGLLLSLVFYRRRRSVVVESPTAVPDDYPPRY